MIRDKRLIFLLLGIGLLVYLVWRVGPESVWGHLALVGWGVLPILATSVAWKTVNTIAWIQAFPPENERPGFWKLLSAALAGDVANHIFPSGGEVAKSYLIRSHVSVSSSLPTVVVDKTMEILSGLLFTVLGVIVALMNLPLAAPVRYGLVGSIVIGTVGVLLAVRLQSRRPLSRLIDLLARLPIPTRSLELRRDSAARVDAHLASFYATHVARFWCGFWLHFVSWILGTLETYYIIHFMDVEITFLNAFLLTSLTSIVKMAFFFVPAGIGAFEAGHAYLFFLLHFSPAVGLSVALVKRFRRLFWMCSGILLFYGQLLLGRRNGSTVRSTFSKTPFTAARDPSTADSKRAP